MRIAILSMQRVVNFGSVLQAWSLREMIREVTGEEAAFLDIEDLPSVPADDQGAAAQDYASAAQYPGGIVQRAKRWIISRLSSWNKRLIRQFMHDELHLDAGSENAHYDYVVIGSDEVFNHSRGVRLQLHGAVRQADHVFTYAASCGTAAAAMIRKEDYPQIRNAMQRLEAVSVRDEGTEKYVSVFYDGPVVHHLDPVLMGCLHEQPRRNVWMKRYLLVYAYGQRIRTAEEIDAICRFAKAHKLKTVAIGGSQFWCDIYIPVSPCRVLDWFAHAEYVVTDTFHGSIFSVITKRPFAALIRPSNENKMTCLLRDLALSDRRVKKVEQLAEILTTPIDYEKVESLLTAERERARKYLKELFVDGQRENQSGS